jgi:hypothetical protein
LYPGRDAPHVVDSHLDVLVKGAVLKKQPNGSLTLCDLAPQEKDFATAHFSRFGEKWCSPDKASSYMREQTLKQYLAHTIKSFRTIKKPKLEILWNAYCKKFPTCILRPKNKESILDRFLAELVKNEYIIIANDLISWLS